MAYGARQEIMDRQLGGKLRAYPKRYVSSFTTTCPSKLEEHSRTPESIRAYILLYSKAKCTERPMFRGGCLENRGSPRDTEVSSAFVAYSMPQRWILLDAISRRIRLPSGFAGMLRRDESGCGSFWLNKESSSLGVSTDTPSLFAGKLREDRPFRNSF